MNRESISNIICQEYPDIGDGIEVLALFKKCSALRVGEFLLGSTSGRHKSAAIVFVKSTDRLKLVNIHHFLKCSYVHEIEGRDTTSTLWLADVKFFLSTHAKFGMDILQRFGQNLSHLNHPLSLYFTCRVAYVSTKVKFGHIMGTDSVYVVVPISQHN